VLDGGTGSNFLVGGSGMDTFFVDDRGDLADTWSTVVNFHAGDAVTVWGVTPQDFNLAFVDNEGAAGFTGLTLHATAPSESTASVTFAGFTTADLSNGRISESSGTVGGSTYTYFHANS
jgi:Ca2+-binding RTX toxin-like protein